MIEPVYTPGGVTFDRARGLVGKGEVLYNYATGESSTVKVGQYGKDTVPTNIGEDGTYDQGRDVNYDPHLEQYDNNTAIAGNDIDITDPNKRTFAEQARVFDERKHQLIANRDNSIKKTIKYAKLSSLAKDTINTTNNGYKPLINNENKGLENVLKKQKDQHEFLKKDQRPNYNKYDSGKIPTLARILPTITGVGASLAQLAHWGTNPIRKVNTYQQNPYGNKALNILGSMRENPYPAVKGALDAERRANYSINQSGGLSGSQRYLGRIAQGIGNMQNIANIYQNADKQNKAYKTTYANALLQEGNSIASRMQNAAQHDWADFVASHGAKTRGIEQAMANAVGQVAGGFQNEFKYRAYQDTLDLYRQEAENNKPYYTWSPMNAYLKSPYYGDAVYYYSNKKKNK